MANSTSAPQISTKGDSITVTNSALATIIGLAAHEVPGVVGMAPANITEGLKRILGVQQVDEGVVVSREQKDEQESIHVDLYVAMAYGVNIPAVADAVYERVQYAVESLAGIQLSNICVHVAGVSRG